MDAYLEGKLLGLRDILASFESAIVSYSGGVDSTLLAFLAREVLGERMRAVTFASPLLPPRELDRAANVAASLDFHLQVIETDELSLPGLENNPPDRCYACKRFRLQLLRDMATEEGWEAVLEGNNLDDLGMHRPGRRASRELSASSPLEEAGLGKADVRNLARELGLPNWDAPSRPCLATRFPYGMGLERDLLRTVDTAEEALEAMGVRELRVRVEARDAVRLEIGEREMPLLDEKDRRDRLVAKLRALGLRQVKLDLEGFRSGSMDEGRSAGRCSILYIETGIGERTEP
jgi:pyridinium-3,5-biscarboxylic acid mononucleotide sulfurtransferase